MFWNHILFVQYVVAVGTIKCLWCRIPLANRRGQHQSVPEARQVCTWGLWFFWSCVCAHNQRWWNLFNTLPTLTLPPRVCVCGEIMPACLSSADFLVRGSIFMRLWNFHCSIENHVVLDHCFLGCQQCRQPWQIRKAQIGQLDKNNRAKETPAPGTNSPVMIQLPG